MTFETRMYLALALAAAFAAAPGAARAWDAKEFHKPSDAELRQRLTPAAVQGDPGGRHRAALPQRILGQPQGGHLRRHRLRRTAVQLQGQIRVRHRLAEFHPSRWNRGTS